MIQQISPGWTADVDRGPDWLFVRLSCQQAGAADSPDVAEAIWRLMQQQFCPRLVVQLDELQLMASYLVGELVKLHKRVTTQGGIMRLCGVSDRNQEVFRICRLDDRFPQYASREAAVMGHRPGNPR